MFYITAHTVTQNQFADVGNEVILPNIESPSVCINIPANIPGVTSPKDVIKVPVILLPCDLSTRDFNKVIEKGGKMHQNIIADGLRSHTTSFCSTKSMLSDDLKPSRPLGSESIFVILMAIIFALLLLTLITLVCIRVAG